ncbi:MAG: CPBP family intramembrane metalloprotease [Acidobacteriaceae bacterium]|nr:CPBP family intramembrane metalloprotease [Acidobacteriaceae bacterium]
MLPDDLDATPLDPETPRAVENSGAETTLPTVLVPEQPARDPFWGYSDLALVVGLLIASVAILIAGVGAFALVYRNLRSDPTPLLLPTQFALYLFVYLSFWADFKLRYNKPVFTSLGWRQPNVNLIACAVGGVILAFAISALASVLHTPKIDSPFDKLASSTFSTVVFGIMAVAIGPLFEELFFRGFIQPLLSRSFGTLAGILLTAVLFGSLHAPEYSWAWQYALAVSLAGAAFGWLRARTNSIIPSTVMHACFNAVSVAALAYKHTDI